MKAIILSLFLLLLSSPLFSQEQDAQLYGLVINQKADSTIEAIAVIKELNLSAGVKRQLSSLEASIKDKSGVSLTWHNLYPDDPLLDQIAEFCRMESAGEIGKLSIPSKAIIVSELETHNEQQFYHKYPVTVVIKFSRIYYATSGQYAIFYHSFSGINGQSRGELIIAEKHLDKRWRVVRRSRMWMS